MFQRHSTVGNMLRDGAEVGDDMTAGRGGAGSAAADAEEAAWDRVS